jgi:thymidylate synthase ThyX
MTSSTKAHPREKMQRLILAAGGEIEDELFVARPGCMILSETRLSPEAQELYKAFHIDQERPAYEQNAEFKSRITYLSFRDEAADASGYNERMAKELQHLSVYSAQSVEFLIAGISIETSLELVAHGEASVGRLTSSKTKAMNETFYRIQGSLEERERQKAFTRDFLELFAVHKTKWAQEGTGQNWTEFENMLNIPTKVTALTYTMKLKDYHKLFIGRLSPKGNETEVQEICAMMCERLHARFPMVIRSVDAYYAMNNGEKYR